MIVKYKTILDNDGIHSTSQDELLMYSSPVILRCKNILAWSEPSNDVLPSGTKPFTARQMEEFRRDSLSVVRLAKRCLGDQNYSAFVANKSLGDNFGFDAEKVEFIPAVSGD